MFARYACCCDVEMEGGAAAAMFVVFFYVFHESIVGAVAVQGSIRRGLNTFEQLRQAAAASVLAYPINFGFTAVQLLNGTVYVARQPADTASPELLAADRVGLRDSKEVDESKCIVLDLRGRLPGAAGAAVAGRASPAAGRASPAPGRASPAAAGSRSGGTPKSPLSGHGSPSPRVIPAQPRLDAVVDALQVSADAQLCSTSEILRVALAAGIAVSGDLLQRVASLGLHRLPGGVRDEYDLELSPAGDAASGPAAEQLVLQRRADGERPANHVGPWPKVAGISSFIIASGNAAVRSAAHDFMADLTAKKGVGGTVGCKLLPVDALIAAGYSIWIDSVLASSGGIPIIFHVTITPAGMSMPKATFLEAFEQLAMKHCCLVKLKGGADGMEAFDDFQLPPPAPTAAVPVTPMLAKPEPRRAGLSDPAPVIGSGTGTPASVPGTLSRSPFPHKLVL